MPEWTIDVEGRPCVVSVTAAPNGKRFVRADGRIVAPPQSGPSIDCTFALGSVQFRLTGNGEELQLERLTATEPVSREIAPAVAPMKDAGFVRRRVVVFAVFGALLFAGSSAMALVGWAVQMIDSANTAQLGAQSPFWKAILANQELISRLMRLRFLAEALLGAGAVAGAFLLAKRMSWAPLFLEIVSWSVPGAYVAATLMIEPFVHRHVGLFGRHREALEWYEAFHRSTAIWMIVAAGAAGALLMFLQRERLERVQRSEPA